MDSLSEQAIFVSISPVLALLFSQMDYFLLLFSQQSHPLTTVAQFSA